MPNFDKNIMTILASEAFVSLLACETIQIAQLNAAIALLVRTSIPFDIEYSPGTRRLSPAAKLTIYINPNTRLSFILSFAPGPTAFGVGVAVQ